MTSEELSGSFLLATWREMSVRKCAEHGKRKRGGLSSSSNICSCFIHSLLLVLILNGRREEAARAPDHHHHHHHHHNHVDTFNFARAWLFTCTPFPPLLLMSMPLILSDDGTMKGAPCFFISVFCLAALSVYSGSDAPTLWTY